MAKKASEDLEVPVYPGFNPAEQPTETAPVLDITPQFPEKKKSLFSRIFSKKASVESTIQEPAPVVNATPYDYSGGNTEVASPEPDKQPGILSKIFKKSDKPVDVVVVSPPVIKSEPEFELQKSAPVIAAPTEPAKTGFIAKITGSNKEAVQKENIKEKVQLFDSDLTKINQDLDKINKQLGKSRV